MSGLLTEIENPTANEHIGPVDHRHMHLKCDLTLHLLQGSREREREREREITSVQPPGAE